MTHFASFLFSNPIFAFCFFFYIIPFWVPVLGFIYGFDPVLMSLFLFMTIYSKAYIDSEMTFRNPFSTLFSYLFTLPLITLFKFITVCIIVSILAAYGMSGEVLDKWIAAITVIFIIKLFYIKETPEHWRIKGLRTNKVITTLGSLLVVFLWLSFFGLNVAIYEKLAIGLCAMLVSALTYLKKNEGLI